MRLLGILLTLFVYICVNAYLAHLMKKAGIAKGYGEDAHIWAICFWLGIMGYLYVIALPDKILQRQNQKIIELLEDKK